MTEPYYTDDLVTLYHGDCLDVLRELPDASVDAVVTDPPYGLEFMGKEWDAPWKGSAASHADARTRGASELDDPVKGKFIRAGVNAYEAGKPFQQWCEQWAAECLRVLKPGGHMLAFGGTRTWHRLACAIEDAGFEVRDSIAWVYGSGFPKSLDVSKAIDRAAGAERTEVLSRRIVPDATKVRPHFAGESYQDGYATREYAHTAPATDDARRWQGWGTALKPAFEPVVVARKPLAGTVAQNVLAHGTGALNIDATRIGTGGQLKWEQPRDMGYHGGSDSGSTVATESTLGRWPANVVLDESQAAELDRQSGVSRDGVAVNRNRPTERSTYDASAYEIRLGPGDDRGYGGEGGASRFFYVAKAPTAERPRVPSSSPQEAVNERSPRCAKCGLQRVNVGDSICKCAEPEWVKETRDYIAHPTVKPLDLMRWLVRLVTPPGGVVLEPFAGSGTTAEACVIEGFRCIAIEREADYLPLIVQRLTKPIQPDLFGSLGGDVA